MKPCKLTMCTWHGDEPLPGQFLKSPRGRTAFMVLGIARPKKPGAKYAFKATCERRAPSSLTAADVVFAIRWNSRG